MPGTCEGAGSGHCITCHHLKRHFNQSKDGVYQLCLWDGSNKSREIVPAYCDMANGGYTYIHQDNWTNFNRSWSEYVNGFGTVGGEGSYWLGLKAMHLLTTQCGQSQARIVLGTDCAEFSKRSAYEDFSSFKVGDAGSNYALNLSGPIGTAGDGDYSGRNWGMNGQAFTAYNADNDGGPANCAADHGAGWWYKKCGASLTGHWYRDCGEHAGLGVVWRGWPDQELAYSLQYAAIKIRSRAADERPGYEIP